MAKALRARCLRFLMGKKMTTKAVLVTGANGEIGRGIIDRVSKESSTTVVAIDLNPPADFAGKNIRWVKGDILDAGMFGELSRSYEFETIYHLAALLSSTGERDPERAHRVNVEGSLNLLTLARTQSERTKVPVTFVFPSTIAAYGIPLAAQENAATTAVREDQFLEPITMYGVNKLYIENLGRYYSHHYRMFEGDRTRIDFRCVRLPGVLCADTMPTGGTSDYGPEMVHAAAQGKTYECFVTPEARLPFIVKTDAVSALVGVGKADRTKLTQSVYNVTSFSPSALEIKQEISKYFPKSEVLFKPHPQRLQIVQSWPRIVDDSAARRDWGWQPEYDFERAFREYLVPGITKRYSA